MINKTEAIYRYICSTSPAPTVQDLHDYFGISKNVIAEALRELMRRRAITTIPVDRGANRPLWAYHRIGPEPKFRRARGQAGRLAMAMLASGRELTASELARETGLTLTHAAHVLNRLQRQGLLDSERRDDKPRKHRTYWLRQSPMAEAA